ncbi:hypothetical protein VDGL01_10865 [Verticillium dahliae]
MARYPLGDLEDAPPACPPFPLPTSLSSPIERAITTKVRKDSPPLPCDGRSCDHRGSAEPSADETPIRCDADTSLLSIAGVQMCPAFHVGPLDLSLKQAKPSGLLVWASRIWSFSCSVARKHPIRRNRSRPNKGRPVPLVWTNAQHRNFSTSPQRAAAPVGITILIQQRGQAQGGRLGTLPSAAL